MNHFCVLFDFKALLIKFNLILKQFNFEVLLLILQDQPFSFMLTVVLKITSNVVSNFVLNLGTVMNVKWCRKKLFFGLFSQLLKLRFTAMVTYSFQVS